MNKILVVVLFLIITLSSALANSITLTGTLRDFNQDHVDFEPHMDWENGLYNWPYKFYDGVSGGLVTGLVLPELDSDRKPLVNDSSDYNLKPQKLYEWYHDVDGVNMRMPYTIELEELGDGTGVYQFSSDAFFPADDKLFGKENYHGEDGEEYQHNFHLTYEIHTRFTYQEGQVFNFVGDDDVWVFIDNKLVVDLGGLHSPESGSVNLDDLGLTAGESYNFDFFWAERHTTGSNFTITTSIELEPAREFPEAIYDYRFDECAWNGLTREVKELHGHDGVSRKGATTQQDALVNRSGYFNGENYVDAGDIFNDINDTFTITAWIKPENLTDAQTNHKTKNTFLAKASDAKNDNLEIGVNPDGSLHLYLDTKGRDKYADIGDGITTDSWHFVAVRYDGNSVTVTIDENSFSNTTTWANGGDIDGAQGSPFTIGASLHVDNFFKGGIDEVKVYDTLLRDGEISTIYQNEKSGRNLDGSKRELSPCPVTQYRFDSCKWYGKAGEVIDAIGNSDGEAINDAQTDDSGQVSRSALFTGSEYIQAESDFSLLDDFTISFWLNPASIQRSKSYMAVLSKQIEVYLKEDNKLHINMKNRRLNPDTLTTNVALVGNSWSYIVLEKNGDTFTCYINGTKDSDKRVSSFSENGLDDIIIGKTDWDGAELYQGKIDELLFFTLALDSTKREELYQNELSGKNYDGATREEKLCLAPIGCKEEAIVIDDNKYVFEVDLATGTNHRFIMDDSAGGINGFGLNKKDGYVWGYNQTKKDGTLLRVGKTEDGNYSQEVFGPIDELNGKSFYIGDIDDDGQLYLYGSGTIYIIDIDPASNTFLSVLDSFKVGSIRIADMAFNPIDKQLYAIENDNDLYQIDLENQTTHLKKRDVIDTVTDTFGSSFFDAAGFFYAIKNSSRDVYRIDLSDENNIRSLKFSSLTNNDVQNVNIDGGRCNDKPIYIDYGDAPDSSAYNHGDGTSELNYKTLTSDNGPRHKLSEDGALVFFGEGIWRDNISSESDAKDGNRDDDNGIVEGINPLYTSMYHYSLKVAVHNDSNKSANVVGWIDFNRNGRFEMLEGTKVVVDAESEEIVTLKWNVPDNIQEGITYARFRVTTDDMDTLESDSYGVKNDGEVEDYEIDIKRGSLYDAWDLDSNLTQRVIQTKLVNQDISVNIASVSRDGESLIENTFTNIKAGLFSRDDHSMLHDFVDVNFSLANPYRVDFGKIAKASKYSYVKISYLNESNVTKEVNATDAFAIRPDRYKMQVVAPDGLVAGKEFNITIEALDALGSVVTNYDENMTVYGLDYNETLASSGCDRGVLTAVKVPFSQGKATIVSDYNNVGKLDLKVYEIEDMGREFAVVDQDDGSASARYIHADSLQTTQFSPAKLVMSWDFKNGSNLYTFYDSNLTEMAASLDISLQAQDKDNVIVTNFRDGCYAEDVAVKVDFHTEGVTQSVTPVPDTTVAYTDPLSDVTTNTFSFKVLKGDFSDGEGNETVRINFQRANNKPLEPMKFTLTDINASIAGGVSVFDSQNKSATFVYVRVHVPDQNTIGKNLVVPVDYEVYSKHSDRSLFGLDHKTESKDSINWYIINSDINMDYVDLKSLFPGAISVSYVSRDEMNITVNKLPHSNIISYTPAYDYLKYDRFNAAVDNHKFKVHLSSDEAKWTGKGGLGSTIDKNAYKGNGLQKIDW